MYEYRVPISECPSETTTSDLNLLGGHIISHLTVWALGKNYHGEALTSSQIREQVQSMAPEHTPPDVLPQANRFGAEVSRLITFGRAWEVEKDRYHSTYSRLTGRGYMQTLAFTGIMLGWQIDYPELGLPVLWGERQHALQERDTFSHRFQVLHRLASRIDANSNLHSLRYRGHKRTYNEVDRLITRGVVDNLPPAEGSKKRRIQLAEAWQQPVQDLLQRIVQLSDPDYEKVARRRALTLNVAEIGIVLRNYDKRMGRGKSQSKKHTDRFDWEDTEEL